MGQECCQGAIDDSPYVNKAIFFIKQNQFDIDSQFGKNDPLIKQKIPNIQQKTVFKHKQSSKYYIGQWKDEQANGNGSLYMPGTLYYEGLFQNGIPQGQGQMLFLNKQEEYKGNFSKGRAHGYGLYKNNTKKITFEGQWVNSRPLNGILMFEDNQNIQNIYIKNFEQGQAKISYKDGRIYEGLIDQQRFIPEGKGKLTFLDGSIYSGNWKNGLMHGEGEYLWKDGSKYQGQYLNGKKQGFGVFYYFSGKKYEGEWLNGKQQGKGKIITKDGEIQKDGYWKDGKYEPLCPQQKKRKNQHEKQIQQLQFI